MFPVRGDNGRVVRGGFDRHLRNSRALLFRDVLTILVVILSALGGALFRVSGTGYKRRTILVFVEVYPLARADFCSEAHSSGEPLGKTPLG